MRPTPAVVLSLLLTLLPAPAGLLAEEPGAAATPTGPAVARSQLLPVPAPDLSDLEDVVADQLGGARRTLETTLADVHATADQLAEAYGRLGELYHAYGLLDAAAACYGNAVQLAPGDFRWLHLLADVNRRQGDLEAAAAHFQAAWSLQPRDFAALVHLGDVERERGRDEEAEAAYRSALALSPGSPSALAGLGQLALGRREFAEAASDLETALRAVPGANRLHYSLAMAYRGLGRTEDAKRQLDLRGTVGVRPTDPLLDRLPTLTRGSKVRILRGRAAFAAGRYEEARDEFAAAVEAAPDDAGAVVNLGTSQARMGDAAAAAETYRRALQIDPHQTTAHFDLGALLLAGGRAAEAVPHLQAAAAALPNDAGVQLALARALVATGDDDGSLAHFQRAAGLDPANEDAVVEGAGALVRLGHYSRARAVLEAGLKQVPDSVPIAFALGRLLAAAPDAGVRDGARALKLAQTVYTAEPTPRHAQLVAQAFAELGRCDDAAQWQQKVVDQALAEGARDVVDTLRADLATYQAGAPCRAPVRP